MTPDHAATISRAVLAGFLEDASLLAGAADVRERPASALAAHREHLRAWYRDLVGALVVPPGLVRELLDALDGEDHGLRVVLATGAAGLDAPRAISQLRLARDTILDDSRLELIGVEVPLPMGGLFDVQGVWASTGALLQALDFTAPSRIDIGGEGSRRADVGQALTVIADDAAEELALPPTAPAAVIAEARALGLRLHGNAAAAVDGLVGPLRATLGGFVSVAVPSVAAAVAELEEAAVLDATEEG